MSTTMQIRQWRLADVSASVYSSTVYAVLSSTVYCSTSMHCTTVHWTTVYTEHTGLMLVVVPHSRCAMLLFRLAGLLHVLGAVS